MTGDAVVSDRPTAEFDFDVDLDMDWSTGDFTRRDFVTKVQWAIDEFINDVQESVGSDLLMAFDREPVHQYIDDVLSTKVSEALPDGAQIVRVGRVVQGNFEVKYIVE